MNKSQLQELFRKPFDHTIWQQVLTDVFGVTEIRHEPRQLENESNDKVDGYEVGWLDTKDGHHIGIYEFEIKSGHNIQMNRVGLRGFMKGLVKYKDDAALVVFYNRKVWRLSFICDLKDAKTAPKRFTYVFGNPTETYRTPAERLANLGDATLDNIRNAFSVEQLNKDFFKGYKDQFRKFTDKLCEGRTQEKTDRDYAKKLLGRLVFLQFLQKKGWMGVPATNKGWDGGDPNYLQNLIGRHKDNDRLLTDVLEPLFFTTLNTRRDGDIADPILGGNIRIPYLNGGLFDNDNQDKEEIDFPYSYFYELADFFSAYNFTIDENDPDDSEVGIDPEMLGHIFENLLEDNKDKGAFYTPKEIVHYMCRESLVQYLRSHTDEELHKAIDKLVRDGLADFFAKNRPAATTIDNLLREVKICDPAIGSGAFPMGLLSEIFRCRRLLYGHLKTGEPFSPSKIKREIIQENIYGVDIEQGAVDIARLRFWLSLVVDESQPEPLPNLDYKIMQGNSLLESFEGEDLSVLYKDDETAGDLFSVPKKRQDIIELQSRYFSTTDHAEKSKIKSEINEIIIKHLENSLRKKKQLLVKEWDKTIQTLAANLEWIASSKGEAAKIQKNLDKQAKVLATLEAAKSELDNKSLRLKAIDDDSRPFFLWHLFFKDVFDRGGFDIIIANPPYIQLQNNGGFLAEQLEKERYETFARTGDIYCIFYEKGIDLLRGGGIESYITSSKWMRAAYGEKLRSHLAGQNPVVLIELGPGVFDSATVDTNILIVEKSPARKELKAVSIKGKEDFKNLTLQPLTISADGSAWILKSPIEQSIDEKVLKYGTPLKDWDIDIYRGVLTGYNEAFIIDGDKRAELIAQDPISEELIKPILRGRGIDRYVSKLENLYIVFIPWHFPLHKVNTIKGASVDAEIKFKEDYPAVYNYLTTHKDGLSERNKAETGIRYEWYALQRCAATYYEELSLEKIVWKRIGSILRFCYDDTGSVVLDSTCFSSGPYSKYLVAVLNSKMGHYLLKDAPMTGTGDLLISVQALEPVRIPLLSAADRRQYEDLVDQILAAKSANPAVDTSALESEIDRMVYDLYGLTQEEIKIIEK